MQALPRLYKLWPWVDLDPFYAKVRFGYIGLCMGENENYLFFGNYCSLRSFVWEKMKIIYFFGNYCSLRSQSCLKHSAKWVNEVEWVSKVKVIFWPWSKITQILKLNVWFWPVYSGERFRASGPSCYIYYCLFQHLCHHMYDMLCPHGLYSLLECEKINKL